MSSIAIAIVIAAGHREDLPAIGDARTEDRDRHREAGEHRDAAEPRRRLARGGGDRRRARPPPRSGARATSSPGTATMQTALATRNGGSAVSQGEAAAITPAVRPDTAAGIAGRARGCARGPRRGPSGSSKPLSMLCDERGDLVHLRLAHAARGRPTGVPSRIPLGLNGDPPWPGEGVGVDGHAHLVEGGLHRASAQAGRPQVDDHEVVVGAAGGEHAGRAACRPAAIALALLTTAWA